MKRPARRRAAPRRGAKVGYRLLELAARERGPRGVLVKDVGEDLQLERALHGLEGGVEPLGLEIREVELAQQHRVRRPIDGSAGGEALLGEACARRPGPRGHRTLEELFRSGHAARHGPKSL